MTLSDILEQQRSLYLEEFANRLASFSAEVAGLMQPEALYLLADGTPVRTGTLALPARGDVCVRNHKRIEEIARIDSARTLGFDAFRFVWQEALQVALHPFVWNNCQLCIPEPIEAIDQSVLACWFETAIKPELGHGERNSLLGAVHSLSAPRTAADGVRFEVDFGSAPVAAFENLLTALVQAGAGLVVIGRGESAPNLDRP